MTAAVRVCRAVIVACISAGAATLTAECDTQLDNTAPGISTTPTPTTTGSVHYSSCKEARDAGAAPLHTSDPGYRPQLDRDHNGTACE